jgi:chorismate mutase/prephenate dehydratase
MEDTHYHTIEKKLKVSVEKLYEDSKEVLNQIEEGLVKRKKEMPVVGYQGVVGSFGEEATNHYFKDKISEKRNYTAFEEVLKALSKEEIDYGVLPIENSFTGEVLEVYDLVNKYDLHIVGEELVKVEHNLLAPEGASVEALEEVYSHPQAFGQCKSFLEKHAHIKFIPYANTAMAGEYVATLKDPKKGAIASMKAAKTYGLQVLETQINTNQDNYTRFIVLARKMEITPICDKVSILFTTSHTSGALYKVLSHFAYNGLNLLKIQSRPTKDKKWHYFFFVDLEGNLGDASMLIALGKVKKDTEYLKILGNYPKK